MLKLVCENDEGKNVYSFNIYVYFILIPCKGKNGSFTVQKWQITTLIKWLMDKTSCASSYVRCIQTTQHYVSDLLPKIHNLNIIMKKHQTNPN